MSTKKPTTQATPSVKELLLAMSDADRQALLHSLKEEGVKVTAAKVKEPVVYVAQRTFKKDSPEGARIHRTKGEVQLLTEKSLMNILQTWVRKDADVRIPLIVKSIKDGNSEDFANFVIQPVAKA